MEGAEDSPFTQQPNQNGEATIEEREERKDQKRKRRRKSERRKQSSNGTGENQKDDFPEKHRIDVEELKRRMSEDSEKGTDHNGHEEDKPSLSRLRRRETRTSRAFDTLSECRKMFRQEMALLGKEVEQFRTICQNQISKYKRLVLEHQDQHQKQKEDGNTSEHGSLSRTVSAESGDRAWEDMLSILQVDMDFLSRKQAVLDKEQQMLDKEESLSQRQRDLEEYEKEINEIERMLDRRQNLCNKRQRDLASLDDELLVLKSDINTTKDQLESRGINTDSASERAKHNWDIVRKNLFEKQTFLENTVQKYRTDLATAQSNITSKDILLNKLQQEIADLKDEMDKKNIKMHQLESQLTFTLEEARSLEKKFHQILLQSESSIIINNHLEPSPSTSPQKRLLKRDSSRSLLHSPRSTEDTKAKNKIVRHHPNSTQNNHDTNQDARSAILNGKSASCVVM
ncbi:probable serine/threonine-protein kinase kinX isoform X2 [Pecten maximus]|uniref:probable serine/threonine-protein kinase kinX isoform X2 n=1 Tax=Pecten maximus TaxID=6579 RepID=UPI00145851ED|nr:probable serine/threonine-protein kinase kinX isoform X2 [Pecten maximus]